MIRSRGPASYNYFVKKQNSRENMVRFIAYQDDQPGNESPQAKPEEDTG
jgi:hypothetical protein